MKHILLPALLLLSSWSIGQTKNFEDLFQPVGSLCWEAEKKIIDTFLADGLQEASGDSLIQIWESYCGANEASIRTRLLYDLKFKGQLDTSVPLNYWRIYIGYLAHDEYLSSHLKRHLSWCHDEAQKLLKSKEWGAYEKGVLGLFAHSSLQSAYEPLLKKEVFYEKGHLELREYLEEKITNEGKTGLGLAYSYIWLNGSLAEELGALHAISLLGEVNLKPLTLGINLGFAFSEQKAYLDFNNQGDLVNSDLEELFHLEILLGYDFYRLRRQHFQAFLGVGINNFSTDIEFLNEFDEQQFINISSVYPTVGLDYHFQVYGSRSIGIRTQLQLMDYGNNEELRSGLSGIMLRNSLYFRL